LEVFFPAANGKTIYEQSSRRFYYGESVTRAASARGLFSQAVFMGYKEDVNKNVIGHYFGVNNSWLYNSFERDAFGALILQAIVATPWCGLEHFPTGGYQGEPVAWTVDVIPHNDPGHWTYWGRSDPYQPFTSRWGHVFNYWHAADLTIPFDRLIKATGYRLSNGVEQKRAGIVGAIAAILFLLFLLFCCVSNPEHIDVRRRINRRRGGENA
jgi:hypothetical protein